MYVYIISHRNDSGEKESKKKEKKNIKRVTRCLKLKTDFINPICQVGM